MRLIACHNGKLQHLAEVGLRATSARVFQTGLAAIDSLAPGGAFVRGAVHEVLTERAHGEAKFFATILARAATQGESGGPIIWCDPKRQLYPPALVELGIDLASVYLLHPKNEAEEKWAVAECLRCRGVGVVIASFHRLTRIEARRLQLAAETGQSVAILLRHTGAGGAGADVYAAATRWLAWPHPGERTVVRWKIQLVHGHGRAHPPKRLSGALP